MWRIISPSLNAKPIVILCGTSKENLIRNSIKSETTVKLVCTHFVMTNENQIKWTEKSQKPLHLVKESEDEITVVI